MNGPPEARSRPSKDSQARVESLFDSLTDFDAPSSTDPLRWPGYPDKIAAARRRTGQPQAVRAGEGLLKGHRCVAVEFNFNFLGGSMGHAEGELIIYAIDHAAHHRLPLVSVTRSGGARMQEGTVALFQMARISRSLVQLSAAGVPHIAVADDPTTGGVWAALVAAADVIIAPHGAQIGFAGTRVRTDGQRSRPTRAEDKWEAGFIDALVHRNQLAHSAANYLQALSPQTRGDPEQPPVPHLDDPDAQPPRDRTGWQNVLAARNSQRASYSRYLENYFDSTTVLSGDRVGGRAPEVVCGLGRREGRTIAFVCQDGQHTSAAAFRTASRVLTLAARLRISAITFIDTQGATNDAAAERLGVGTAIAELMKHVASSTTPILSIVIGQGVSGGAMALINPDNLWMACDSYLAVIAPESATEILKQGPDTIPQVANQLLLGPHDLQHLGLSRGVLA